MTTNKEIIDTLIMLIVWGRETNDAEMVQLGTRKLARMTGDANIEPLVDEWQARSKPKKRNTKIGS